MLKKWLLTLGFVFLTILVMGGSCGGGGPQAKLGNVSDTSLALTAPAGATATVSFTFENTGDATLDYTITETLDFLEITQGATGTVAASATATVSLEATCTSEGTLNGTITVESNGGDAEIDVEVICTAPTAQLGNLSDTSLSLTGQVGASAGDSFTFENTGQANLTYTTSTSAAFLEVTQGASGTVAAGATATVTLEATCTTEGTSNGNVSIDSNGGDTTVAVTLTCTPAPVSSYNIDLEFVGSAFTSGREAVFEAAAAKWESIIITDLADITGITKAEGFCTQNLTGFPDEPAFNGDVDDLYIAALIAPIDGLNGTLGAALPCLIRQDGGTQLPVYGVMVFDSADIAGLEAAGKFDEVILHEMGHVLGVGSYWDAFGFLDYTTDSDIPDKRTCTQAISSSAIDFVELPTFNGSQAVQEFADNLGGSGQPLVEDLEQRGTGCSHWDEKFFDNELMTGFINAVTPGPLKLSKLTVASLGDLGYDINLNQADVYRIPDCSPSCASTLQALRANQEPWELVFAPKGFVHSNGEIVLFNNQ